MIIHNMIFTAACIRNAEFTPGRSKGIDYIFAGENRRLKKAAAAPTSTEAPSSEFLFG
jgi:hypothetical protein